MDSPPQSAARPIEGPGSCPEASPAQHGLAPGVDLGAQLELARPALFSYARRLTGGRARLGLEHEDLVQDTLERAIVSAASFDPARPALPWLRRICLRRFLDLRARALGGSSGREPAEEPRATDAGLRALEDREEVLGLLERLGEPERTILDRFHRAGVPIAQLAEELNLPSGTIKSHLHRARRRLAALFATRMEP